MAGQQQQRKQLFNPSELAEVDENVELGAVPSDLPATPPVESTPADGAAPPPQADVLALAEQELTDAHQPIPYGRWQEFINGRNKEREERKAEQEALAQLREKWARLDERSKQIREAQEAAARQVQQQREAAERPDPAIDPVGAKIWDQDKAIRDLTAWKQQREQADGQFQQQYQQDQQTTQFNNWVVAEANNYAHHQKDYFDAARHAAKWRMDFWSNLGLPPDQAQQLVMHESNLLARISQQTGKPFAPIVYELAKSVGYRPRPEYGDGNGNGAAPTSAAASQAGKVLSQVAKGQAMQGLSRAPSAGGEAKSRYRDMTPADIANMTEAEFSAALNNPQTKAEMEYAMARADGLEGQEVNYRVRR